MPICFTNPGELDIRAAITMGVNAKDGPGAIGYFGTGLKYAIAVLLRNDCSLRIFSGKDRYQFKAHNESIRGRDFPIVYMSKNDGAFSPLGFTTELGRNWTLSNAYRELWSNCMDEKGEVKEVAQAPRPGHTQIIVIGDFFDQVHQHRHYFILDTSRKMLHSNPGIEVREGHAEQIFYRGIAVHKLRLPSLYTYNILGDLSLTEDRTASLWDILWRLRDAFEELPRELRVAALISSEWFEHDMDWHYSTPGPDLRKQVLELAPVHFKSLSANLLKEVQRIEEASRNTWTPEEFSATHQAMLDCATLWLSAAGYAITTPVHYRTLLGHRVHGCYYSGAIWLGPDAFSSQEHLQAVLLEEHLHAVTGKTDESREFQNAIIAELVKAINRLNEFHAALPGIDPRSITAVDYETKMEPPLATATLDDNIPF